MATQLIPFKAGERVLCVSMPLNIFWHVDPPFVATVLRVDAETAELKCPPERRTNWQSSYLKLTRFSDITVQPRKRTILFH